MCQRINFSIIGCDSMACKPPSSLKILLPGIFIDGDFTIITSCMKYKVLNMLQTFICVGEMSFLFIPLRGSLKSILYGGIFIFISSGPRSMPECSYSSKMGHPSTISYSLTICFFIFYLYCPLFEEFIMFWSSVSLLIYRPLISCL